MSSNLGGKISKITQQLKDMKAVNNKSFKENSDSIIDSTHLVSEVKSERMSINIEEASLGQIKEEIIKAIKHDINDSQDKQSAQSKSEIKDTMKDEIAAS